MSVLEIILLCLAPSVSMVLLTIYLHHRDKSFKKKELKSSERDKLIKELQDAVLNEDYEKATELRNRIYKIKSK